MYNFYLSLFYKLGIPSIFAVLTWPVVLFVFVATLLVITVLFLVLFERKLLALMTVRKGPNRVGPFGLFQTVADAIKLLFKEDIMSSKSNKFLFTIAPVIVFVPILVVYGLVPFSGDMIAVNIPSGLFLFIAISSISTIGLVIAGWASNNKYSLLGGMRSAAQAISYEVPLVLSALGIALWTGSMDMQEIIKVQSGGLSSHPFLNWHIFSWNIWPSFIGFLVFLVCSIAEINRVPFDLPEAESELVSGYNTEYSGMKFALFFLAEYAGLFIMSVLISAIFLGGYTSPFHNYVLVILFKNIVNNPLLMNLFTNLEQVFWLFTKTYSVIFLIIWIRATLPRLRADQLMAFSWKFLLPLSLINLVILSILKYIFTV